MSSKYQEIIRSGDDTVDGEILQWSGMWEFWEANEKVLGEYSIINDVLEHCSSVDIDQEEWDGGAPGQSGVTFVISTNDPNALRADIRRTLQDLTTRHPPVAAYAEPGSPKDIDTVEALIAFLRREAYRYSKMGAPAGHAGMPRRIADGLNKTADDLAMSQGSREEVIACLKRHVNQAPSSAVDDQIRTIIESYPDITTER